MKKIPPPRSQVQEVLYELINRVYIDRKTMLIGCGVYNLTARIFELRKKGVNIFSKPVTFVNKFGRDSLFVQYKLKDKKSAIAIYKRMQETQTTFKL